MQQQKLLVILRLQSAGRKDQKCNFPSNYLLHRHANVMHSSDKRIYSVLNINIYIFQLVKYVLLFLFFHEEEYVFSFQNWTRSAPPLIRTLWFVSQSFNQLIRLQRELNSRPLVYKPSALTTEL